MGPGPGTPPDAASRRSLGGSLLALVLAILIAPVSAILSLIGAFLAVAILDSLLVRDDDPSAAMTVALLLFAVMVLIAGGLACVYVLRWLARALESNRAVVAVGGAGYVLCVLFGLLFIAVAVSSVYPG